MESIANLQRILDAMGPFTDRTVGNEFEMVTREELLDRILLAKHIDQYATERIADVLRASLS